MADAFSIVRDIIQTYGGYVGTASGGAAAWAYKRFRGLEHTAKVAYTLSKTLQTQLGNLQTELDGLRDELTEFKQTLESRVSRASASSFSIKAEADGWGQRIAEMHDRMDELRGDILRERGARHALQKEFSDFVKSDAEQWRQLHRSLGQIEGRLERYLATQ